MWTVPGGAGRAGRSGAGPEARRPFSTVGTGASGVKGGIGAQTGFYLTFVYHPLSPRVSRAPSWGPRPHVLAGDGEPRVPWPSRFGPGGPVGLRSKAPDSPRSSHAASRPCRVNAALDRASALRLTCGRFCPSPGSREDVLGSCPHKARGGRLTREGHSAHGTRPVAWGTSLPTGGLSRTLSGKGLGGCLAPNPAPSLLPGPGPLASALSGLSGGAAGQCRMPAPSSAPRISVLVLNSLSEQLDNQMGLYGVGDMFLQPRPWHLPK